MEISAFSLYVYARRKRPTPSHARSADKANDVASTGQLHVLTAHDKRREEMATRPAEATRTLHASQPSVRTVLTWCVVYSLHALCAAYFVVAGMVYWGIPSTYLTWYIELYSLTIPLVYYHKVAVAHYVLASLHFFGLVYPVLGVIYFKSSQYWHRRKRGSAVAPNTNDVFGSHSSGVRSFQQSTQRLMVVPRKAHRVLFASHGLFGVESRHFEVVFLTREVVETLLQTYQAYRMSILLPRAALNRSYVALIVLNCWTTPLLHYLVPHNMVLQRTLCILADILLDYASSVGVSTILALTYVHLYDPELLNFPSLLWYEDTWFVNLIIESRIFLFNSWLDAGSRLLFSLSLLVGLHDVKELLSRKATTTNDSASGDKKQRRPSVESSFHHSGNQGTRRVIYLVMVLYGVAIAALQLHAESKGRPASCILEVRPWFVKRQACAFSELSCHPHAKPRLDVGRADEITAMLDKLHAQALTYFSIRHCPAVEIPTYIQSFPAIIGVKLYNCTIASWPSESAFDKHIHTSLRFFFGTRTNFPNNTIPDGLLSPDFPPQLSDIELAYTNLQTLPDDLDAYWPRGMTLFLESGHFDHVPPVIYRLEPFMLVFSGNPLSAIPSELLMLRGLNTLAIRRLPNVTSLPSDGIDVAPMDLLWIYLDYVNISTFPDWMNATFLEQRFVFAGASPACQRLLTDGVPSDSPWLAKIDCVSFGLESTTYYPLQVDKRHEEDSSW